MKMQGGSGLPLNTSMEGTIRMEQLNMVVLRGSYRMSQLTCGRIQMSGLHMLRYGTFRDGGICRIRLLKVESSRWLKMEDLNLSMVAG